MLYSEGLHPYLADGGQPRQDDGLAQFLEVLPSIVRERLERYDDLDKLIEVVLDYGRPAEARFRDRVERMTDVSVSEHDIAYVTKSIGDFGSDNRAGIERTLHRISAIRNRHDRVIGLTCRVGRALEGTIDMIDGIVRSGQSILLLGRPGIGKTTKLREIARVLADEVGKRVVIVDTSNEIAGDGDVPHPAIGSARRMQVRVAAEQHQVMIEAVENHMPEVIVIDEIGTEAEAAASRTIAERGVQLIGTAHGQTLENLMLNPTLCDLVGGIQAVTLSDAEAARRGTQKTVLERKAPPTFHIVIELLDYDRLAVHHDVQKTVDMILRGVTPRPEVRVRTGAGQVEVVQQEDQLELDIAPVPAMTRTPVMAEPAASASLVRVFPYGINRTRLERAIRERKLPATIAIDLAHADVVLAIRSTMQTKPKQMREPTGRSLPTMTIKSNTFAQIADALEDLVRRQAMGTAETGPDAAMHEVEVAVDAVIATGQPIELSPQSAPIRRLQHKAAEARRMASESIGDDGNRRLRILPTRLPV